MSDRHDVLGIDAGLTLLSRTSGICRTGDSGDVVDHTYIDHASRLDAVKPVAHYVVLAIDAPLLPSCVLSYEVRSCEKVFVWGAFQQRCKPGESHIPGTGQALRRAGVDTARMFTACVSFGSCSVSFPRVIEGRNIVEAFPNAFLGVCLEADAYSAVLARGEKTDWLYDRCVDRRAFDRIESVLAWDRPRFWHAVRENQHHDERAALVCAITALCVLRGRFVAVGEPTGGYFFLPPWTLWADWARACLDVNRRDPRLPSPVEVWIDGRPYLAKDVLPKVAG